MAAIQDVISSMKNLKHSMAQFLLATGECTLKLITLFLLIYVVLQSIELPLF